MKHEIVLPRRSWLSAMLQGALVGAVILGVGGRAECCVAYFAVLYGVLCPARLQR